MEEVLGFDEVLGDDDDDDLVGAARRARRRGLAISKPALALSRPARVGPAAIRAAMGWGTAVWTGAADSGDRQLIVEPQEPFRGERLIIDVLATGGTSLGLVVVRRIEIGTMPQTPSTAQPMPAAIFRADATSSQLDLQLAERGTQMTLTLGITASPGAGVTVTAVCGVYGKWVR